MPDDIMQDLRLRFCARLSSDIAVLVAAAEAGDRASIRGVCHRIAGAGGMFGFAALSAAASEAEEAIDAGETLDALGPRVARVLDLAREATASVCGAA
jgi:HPt (histidine-containing phosphotransfer) domain-containing protein